MGLLDYFRAGHHWPQYGEPDTSHIRALDTDVVPATDRATQLFGQAATLSERQLKQAYRSTVFFLANYRARNFARHMLDLTVERRTGQGEFEEVEEEHPWVQLLRRPNDYMPPLEVYLWMYLNRDLNYGAHFIVEHGHLSPVALHPVFASYGRIWPLLGGVGQIEGWIFDRYDGKRIPLRPEDVIRIAHESPFERGQASTLLEAAAFEIDEQLAASIYARDSATDKGRPDVVLESENRIEPAEGNQMSRIFGQKWRAGSRYAGVPWTANGLKVKEFQLTQKDMQFLESRGFNKSQLHLVFETPESLFDAEAYATGRDAAFRAFALNTVQPNVTISVNQLEHGFERIFRADPAALRIAVPNMVPEDRKLQAEIDAQKIASGTLTINEARRRDGDEEVEGGDEPLIKSTLRPLSANNPGF